jgi:hypothetical protein
MAFQGPPSSLNYDAVIGYIPFGPSKSWNKFSNQTAKLPDYWMRDEAHGLVEELDAPICLRVGALWCTRNQFLNLIDKSPRSGFVALECGRYIFR